MGKKRLTIPWLTASWSDNVFTQLAPDFYFYFPQKNSWNNAWENRENIKGEKKNEIHSFLIGSISSNLHILLQENNDLKAVELQY